VKLRVSAVGVLRGHDVHGPAEFSARKLRCRGRVGIRAPHAHKQQCVTEPELCLGAGGGVCEAGRGSEWGEDVLGARSEQSAIAPSIFLLRQRGTPLPFPLTAPTPSTPSCVRACSASRPRGCSPAPRAPRYPPAHFRRRPPHTHPDTGGKMPGAAALGGERLGARPPHTGLPHMRRATCRGRRLCPRPRSPATTHRVLSTPHVSHNTFLPPLAPISLARAALAAGFCTFNPGNSSFNLQPFQAQT
jgi:hypothetical protein